MLEKQQKAKTHIKCTYFLRLVITLIYFSKFK